MLPACQVINLRKKLENVDLDLSQHVLELEILDACGLQRFVTYEA